MQFTHQGFGQFLQWMTLGILCMFPFLAALVVYKLGSLPGGIARSRSHPQAEAINVCGWMGVVWAHVRRGGNGEADSLGNTASLQVRLKALSNRFAEVESRLKTGSGAQP